MNTRRSFFSLFGASTAASAAALNLPEPTEVHQLTPETLYSVQFSEPVSFASVRAAQDWLNSQGQRFGCKFIVLPHNVSIYSLDGRQPAEQPTIVDVADASLGPRRRCLLDGVDISKETFRAELFSDGTGVAYCYKKTHDGHFMFDARRIVMKEVRVGKLELLPIDDAMWEYNEPAIGPDGSFDTVPVL